MSADDERIVYLESGSAELVTAVDERMELDALRELLAARELWEEPSAGLEDNVVAAIADACASDPSVAPVQSVADHPARDPAPVIDLGAARVGRRRSWMALSAAAAMVAIVAAGVIVMGRSDPVDTFAFSVESTDLAPDVGGTVEAAKTDSGWRIELRVDGLSRLDDGEFYEAWLMNDDGILVPVGTFSEGTDVVLWAGVPLVEYSTLSVTVESADGDQSSSGRRVLSAVLDVEP